MKWRLTVIALFAGATLFAQNIDNSYKDYDFVGGEKTLFEDNFNYAATEKLQDKWTFIDNSGKASVTEQDGEKCLSIDAYYTRLKPLLFGNKALPDSFTIEYDTWLDAGYDGNPGIVIHLRKNDDTEVYITPNKHELAVNLPGTDAVAKDNPEPYFGEGKFYNRWVHISIAVYKKQLKVYLDQYKMVEIADMKFKPDYIGVFGDQSQDMKILLKNFRIATGFPTKLFENGKFVTRAIKFDVNKAVLKPESITIIKQVKEYLDKNPTVKLEIDGHTDSDGSDDANLTLSQKRADAVKSQLTSMGIDAARLTTKGFGESKPIDTKNTPEAKANNRRVEFIIVK